MSRVAFGGDKISPRQPVELIENVRFVEFEIFVWRLAVLIFAIDSTYLRLDRREIVTIFKIERYFLKFQITKS